MKIAIIGAGNMGGALARGLANATIVPTHNIYVSNPSTAKLEALRGEFNEINVSTDNRAVVAEADMVVLAVKPWKVGEVVTKTVILFSVSSIFVMLNPCNPRSFSVK